MLEYLPKQLCCSENTIKTYRMALNLWIEFLRKQKQFPISKIDFNIIDNELIVEYLEWLENTRGCSATTRNHRLIILRAFFKYAGDMDCAQIYLHNETKKVPIKQTPGKLVEFLSEDALQTLLKQPNPRKRLGLRDRFFMALMYETAARCDELLKLKVRDIRIHLHHPISILTGKGNKPRPVTLLPRAVEHCKQYLEIFHPNINGTGGDEFLFYIVTHGQKHAMSPDNVAAFMKKHGEAARKICPEVPEKVHPHQLRHTRAIHLYREGMPLALLSEFLGHASPETTKIYAYADAEMQRKAMEKADHMRKGRPAPEAIWHDNEEMILELSGLKI
jgi:site-specific recombinase XerD